MHLALRIRRYGFGNRHSLLEPPGEFLPAALVRPFLVPFAFQKVLDESELRLELISPPVRLRRGRAKLRVEPSLLFRLLRDETVEVGFERPHALDRRPGPRQLNLRLSQLGFALHATRLRRLSQLPGLLLLDLLQLALSLDVHDAALELEDFIRRRRVVQPQLGPRLSLLELALEVLNLAEVTLELATGVVVRVFVQSPELVELALFLVQHLLQRVLLGAAPLIRFLPRRLLRLCFQPRPLGIRQRILHRLERGEARSLRGGGGLARGLALRVGGVGSRVGVGGIRRALRRPRVSLFSGEPRGVFRLFRGASRGVGVG